MNPLSLLENSMPPSQKWTDKIQQAEISKDMVELNNTLLIMGEGKKKKKENFKMI